MTDNTRDTILDVTNLKTYFYTDEGTIPAVDGVDFSLQKGETLAIVGESGCGKSVTALSILRLIANPPGRIIDGSIVYNGTDLLSLGEKAMRAVRGNDISMIFQEPMTSLNPVFTVGKQIMESLKYHQKMTAAAARERAVDMLKLVEIPNPKTIMNNYPHQLSGGMRQRVMIAMALACNPKILIADEPTTALDVTIQAQILKLMADVQKKTGTSIILITHDLGIVAQIAQNVMVMYAGEVVEKTDVRAIFKDTMHPYTIGLLKSIPGITGAQETLYNIKGMVPSPRHLPPGCRFSPRCEFVIERCLSEHPVLEEKKDGHLVRCWNCQGGCLDA